MTTKRPDAATRRAQLLDAADAVFRVHGVNAPLELIVEQAGVGRATLYRQFADRHDILHALMERSVQRLHKQAQSLEGRDDAFSALLQHLGNRIVESPALSDYWRTASYSDPRFDALRMQALQAFAAALERAKQSGQVRADLQLQDFSLISGMLGAALRGNSAAERRRLVQRALDIIHNGLRP
jgi:AcrR family transcriptional regulator